MKKSHKLSYRDEDGVLYRRRPVPANQRLKLLAEFTMWLVENPNENPFVDDLDDVEEFNAAIVSLWFKFHWSRAEAKGQTPEEIAAEHDSQLFTQTLMNIQKDHD